VDSGIRDSLALERVAKTRPLNYQRVSNRPSIEGGLEGGGGMGGDQWTSDSKGGVHKEGLVEPKNGGVRTIERTVGAEQKGWCSPTGETRREGTEAHPGRGGGGKGKNRGEKEEETAIAASGRAERHFCECVSWGGN